MRFNDAKHSDKGSQRFLKDKRTLLPIQHTRPLQLIRESVRHDLQFTPDRAPFVDIHTYGTRLFPSFGTEYLVDGLPEGRELVPLENV